MNWDYENHMTCAAKERNAQFATPPPILTHTYTLHPPPLPKTLLFLTSILLPLFLPTLFRQTPSLFLLSLQPFPSLLTV